MKNYDINKAMKILFVFSMFWSFIFFIMPIYLSQSGLDGYQIGFLMGLYSITSIIVSFPTGFINDRWTTKLALLVGMFLVSMFFIGVSYIHMFLILILLFLMGGIGQNLGDVSIRTIVYKVKTRKEGEKFGLYNFVSSMSRVIGLIVGSVLIFILDFSFALKIIGIIYILTIPFILRMRDVKFKVRLSEYKKDFFNKNALLLGLIMFIFSMHWGAESTSLGLFLKNNLGLNMIGIGIYTAVSLSFLGISAYVFGKKIDKGKINMKKLFVSGAIISGFFMILQTIPITWFSLLMRVIHDVGDGMTMVAVYFWVSKLFTVKRIGGDSSALFTLTRIGQFTGSLIFGPMGYIMGYAMPFLVSGVTNIVSALLLLVVLRILLER